MLEAGFDPNNSLHAHWFDLGKLIEMLEKKLNGLPKAPVENIKESARIYPISGVTPVYFRKEDGVLIYRKGGLRWESPLPLQEDVAHIVGRGGYLKVRVGEEGIEVKSRRVDNFDSFGVSRVHGVFLSHPEGVAYVHLGLNKHKIERI